MTGQCALNLYFVDFSMHMAEGPSHHKHSLRKHEVGTKVTLQKSEAINNKVIAYILNTNVRKNYKIMLHHTCLILTAHVKHGQK